MSKPNPDLCIVCKGPMPPGRPCNIFCGPGCLKLSRRWSFDRKIAYKRVGRCQNCKITMQGPRNKVGRPREYCNYACMKAARLKRKPPAPRYCFMCSEKLSNVKTIPGRYTAYCSEECREDGILKKKRERRARNHENSD